MILSIETSTSNCSVALHSTEGRELAVKERNEQNIHASQLFVFINEILEENNFQFKELSAIAISKGPGSYTGLRIGVSAAKGLCYSLDIPLISVNTLEGMAYEANEKITDKDALLIPMIDARRMEVYNAVYNMNLDEIKPTTATIIDEGSFLEFKNKPCYFFGDGMIKCKTILAQQENTYFMENINATASAIGILAQKKYLNRDFENPAYFEPYYLKEFVSQSTFHRK